VITSSSDATPVVGTLPYRYKGLAFWGLLIVLTRTLLPRLLLAMEERGWIPARKHASAASAAAADAAATKAARAEADEMHREGSAKKQS
jgi:hypothetical protein